MNPHQLDQLPIEVVRQILVSGPVTNVLAISRVNRRLRSICADSLIFSEIAKIGMEQRASCAILNLGDGSWWSYDGKDWHIAARWALADAKLQFSWSKADRSISIIDNCLPWLPELISQGHKQAMIYCSSNVVTSWDQGAWMGGNDVIARAAFHGACQCLLVDIPVLEVVDAKNLSRAQTEVCFNNLAFRSALDIHVPGLTYSAGQVRSFLIRQPASMPAVQNNQANLPNYELSCMIFGVVMVAVLQSSLRRSLHYQDLPNYSSTRSILYPPKTARVPFKSLYLNCPPPFPSARLGGGGGKHSWIDSNQSFLFYHLKIMTSAEFITAGTWIGYHNNGNYQFGNQWDPVMYNIQLVVVADEADYCTVTSHGKGIDKWGSFKLSGSIHKSSGKVQIVSTYDSGQNWPWSAVMTPFGIIGSWGNEVWGGWLWLWKKSWSTSDESGMLY